MTEPIELTYNCATVDKDSTEVIDILKQHGHGVAVISKDDKIK